MPFIHKITYFFLAVIAAGILFFGYLIFLDGTVFNRPINIQSLYTVEPTYKVGTIVYAYLNYCKKGYESSDAKWTMIDGYIRYFPSQPFDPLDSGCHSTMIPLEQIPDDTFPDTYHFSGEISFQVNPLRTITLTVTSNSFKVTK